MWTVDFRNKVIAFMKAAYGSTGTQYRFSKKSNFISYEEFIDEEAADRIISLGKELQRIKDFKNKSDMDLRAAEKIWQSCENQELVDSVSVEQSNALYAKKVGIEGSIELRRRLDEAYHLNKAKA